MKKLLLSVAVMTSFLSFAQLPVSQTAENRNVILEEFTGINCTFCPDGHKIASNYANANAGDVFLVNIHVGGYAVPGAGQPNFRTSFGTAIANQSGLTGYPAGTINRNLFSGLSQGSGTAMSRGNWVGAANQVLADPSYVNLALDATIDVTAMTLTVTVEAYYTGDGSASNKLNVAVLQNGIRGPQTGASSLYPENINPDGTYNHKHMLRHFMTGQWGDDIDTTTAGTLISRTYTWNIPADINGVDVEIADLEIVAYVAEGQQDVVSGNNGPISYVNFPYTTNARMRSASSETEFCNTELNPEVRFQNFGSDTITSVEFSYDVNGSGAMTYTWNGSLNPLSNQIISLPTIQFTDNGSNTLNVDVVNVNGAPDQDASDNSESVSGISKNEGLGDLRLIMRQDRYGSEITWRVRNDAGQVVASGGPYSNLSGNGTVDHTHFLNLSSVECHSIEILDSYGDGINGGYGAGRYWIRQADNSIVLSGDGVFASSIDHPFEYTATVGLEETSLNEATIFPNPADEAATAQIELNSSGTITFTAVNALGQVIAAGSVEGVQGLNNIELQTASWDAGMYYVTLEMDGEQSIQKVNVIH